MASLAASLNMTPGSLRSKSLGARNYRASFAPVNGSSFKSLEQLKFQLPSVPRTYADLTTAVVRGKISSESGAATDVCFIERNIYSIINRLEVSVANQQLDYIPKYNILVHAMSDLVISPLCVLAVQKFIFMSCFQDSSNVFLFLREVSKKGK